MPLVCPDDVAEYVQKGHGEEGEAGGREEGGDGAGSSCDPPPGDKGVRSRREGWVWLGAPKARAGLGAPKARAGLGAPKAQDGKGAPKAPAAPRAGLGGLLGLCSLS